MLAPRALQRYHSIDCVRRCSGELAWDARCGCRSRLPITFVERDTVLRSLGTFLVESALLPLATRDQRQRVISPVISARTA